jgi:hypothetical protein
MRAHSLDIAAQIKKIGGPLLVFAGLWFDIHAITFWTAFRKIQDYAMEEEEEEFEDIKD